MSESAPDNRAALFKRLREPFEAHHISKKPQPTKKDNPKGKCSECGGYHGLPALHLEYVGHAAVTFRMLEVDPEWNWEPMSVDAKGLPQLDDKGLFWIRLTILGVTRLGVGDAETGSFRTDGNVMKERIGDAIRNAGMRFGMALDLWHKGVLDMDLPEDPPPGPAPSTEKAMIEGKAFKNMLKAIEERKFSVDECNEFYILTQDQRIELADLVARMQA